jgi:hypothetical protein
MTVTRLTNLITALLIAVSGSALGQQVITKNLPACPDKPGAFRSVDYFYYHNCFGTQIFSNVGTYLGEWGDRQFHGQGTFTWDNGDMYVGQWRENKRHGEGAQTQANGKRLVGIWENDKFVLETKVEIQRPSNPAGVNREQSPETSSRFISDVNPNKLLPCPKPDYSLKTDIERVAAWTNCWGEYKDLGEYKEDNTGRGTYTSTMGNTYTGEWLKGKPHGKGRVTYADGRQPDEGIFENGRFVRAEKIYRSKEHNNVSANTGRADINLERQQLAEERRRLEEEKHKREQQRRTQRLNLTVTNTQPGTDGSFTIDIQTNADTASLKINGNEEGGRQDGKYILKLVARAGQKTDINIIATDIYGNTDSKIITVSRAIADSKVAFATLNPALVKRQPDQDAVAIIIGIADYKSLPKADFANDDARVFYDYAIRALGIKPENIKLLVDTDADEVAILKAFRTWLPSKVRSSTEVYVYYSGHGYPAESGTGLYLLPQRADREFIARTSIQLQEINADLQAAKPKSVTIFMDACYSGQARNGETLVASARPIVPKVNKKLFPDNFTVITASQADQWSSSSPELKHGIFSYYLMKGMEGEADANKDGRITLGEMQAYLVENVGRQAGMMSRKQEPQLIGDAGRVLVGR